MLHRGQVIDTPASFELNKQLQQETLRTSVYGYYNNDRSGESPVFKPRKNNRNMLKNFREINKSTNRDLRGLKENSDYGFPYYY